MSLELTSKFEPGDNVYMRGWVTLPEYRDITPCEVYKIEISIFPGGVAKYINVRNHSDEDIYSDIYEQELMGEEEFKVARMLYIRNKKDGKL